jgi:uncharacterized membrane protein (DUF2068 family)
MNWDLRHCGRHGHVLFAPDHPQARALLRAQTSDGEAWRCLRCATFVLPQAGSTVPSGPLDRLPVVPRGPELRDRLVLKVLGVERGLRGLIVLILGYGAWRFRNAEGALRDGLRDLLPYARPLATRLGVDLEHTSVVAAAQRLLEVRSSTLTLVAAGLVGYGVLQLVEGYGLWRARRWGEYVAVVATSAFLPIEAYEVLHGGSGLKWGTLAFNLGIVVWLVLSKRLFGVRGGHHAYLASRRGEAVLDPVQLLADPGAEPGTGPDAGAPGQDDLAGRPGMTV